MAFTLAGGASNPGYFNTLDYSGSEDLTIIKGKHQTQVGAQYIRAYMHAQNTRGVNGNLNFTGQYSTVGGTSRTRLCRLRHRPAQRVRPGPAVL